MRLQISGACKNYERGLIRIEWDEIIMKFASSQTVEPKLLQRQFYILTLFKFFINLSDLAHNAVLLMFLNMNTCNWSLKSMVNTTVTVHLRSSVASLSHALCILASSRESSPVSWVARRLNPKLPGVTRNVRWGVAVMTEVTTSALTHLVYSRPGERYGLSRTGFDMIYDYLDLR